MVGGKTVRERREEGVGVIERGVGERRGEERKRERERVAKVHCPCKGTTPVT
jgi:hypothetical protein